MSGWNEGGYEVVQEQGPSEPADIPTAEPLLPEIPVSVETPAEFTPEVASDAAQPGSTAEAQPEMLLNGASLEEPADLLSAEDLAAGPPEAPVEISSGLEGEEEPPSPETMAEELAQGEETEEEETDDLPPVGMS